jgi:suppressor for copper-sensitivity B
VKLTYQACNDTQCLPPIHKEEHATLRIGSGGAATTSATSTTASAAPPAGAPETSAASAPAPGAAANSVAPTAAASKATAPPQPDRGLAGILLFGVLGGLVLNLMPCVLPVLSLKVFSLVKSASLTRREIAVGGMATASGILVSFWMLAGAAIAARQAGAAVGWGVHFQQPAFVALLAVVVVLFTLNMWGIFEVRLPGRVMDMAGGGPREGIAGHFVTGLFATLMATPCSAPFLGTAVAFALARESATVLLVFTAVGLGMSLPYLVLAAWPAAARLLPKPGMWMVRLKEVLGFFLAAAAVWLF